MDAAASKPFYTRQPGKGLVTFLIIAFNTLRFPFWLLYWLPPFTRGHPEWTLRQQMGVKVVREFLVWASLVEMKTPLSLKVGRESGRFAVLPRPPPRYYTGKATIDAEIKPEVVGGTWYPAEPSKGAKPELVLLHFHGGAYAIGDGRPADAGFAAKTLIANTDATHVFAPQYRLATNPNGRFPAQLQDGIACYSYFVDTKGFDPARIVLSGDSAGAHLVVSLLKYLGEHGKAIGLPNPRAALLWSPWTNPHAAMQGYTQEAAAANPNYFRDYTTVQFGRWGASNLTPAKHTGLHIGSPELTFVGHPFATPVPMLVSAGECEAIFPDIIAFYNGMKSIKSNDIQLQIELRAVHDIILVGAHTGFEKEAARGAKLANEFLRRVIKTGKGAATTKL